MATWHVDLPQSFLLSSYKQKPKSNVIRTSMEMGPDKSRRRGTAKIIEHSGSMLMTDAQLTTFETFFETTIEDGALEFDFPGIRDATPISVRITEHEWEAASDEHYMVAIKMEQLP